MSRTTKAVWLATWFMFAIAFIPQSVSAQSTPIIYLEWVEDPTSTIVINWLAPAGSNRTLLYRETGAEDWSSVNADHNSIPGTDIRRFKVEIDGLNENSVFQFRVPGDSDTHSFRTAPVRADEPMRFVVAGDVYTDNPNDALINRTKEAFRNLARVASVSNPYFAALGGDLAHAGSDPGSVFLWFDFLELWQENMVTETGHLVPMVIAIGNNEVASGFGESPEDLIFINALFSFPKDQWGESSFNHYGVLDFGSYLSIFMLNTNHSNQIEGAQTSWLRSQLNQRRSVDHVFPVYHVAGWPSYRTFRGIHEDAVRNNWHNLFAAHNIRFVFEHHDHIFKRTRALGSCTEPITHERDCTFSNTGVIYIGGGSWGSPNSRDYRQDWYHHTVSREHNIMIVEVTRNYRNVMAVNEEGNLITRSQDYIRLAAPEQPEISQRTENRFDLSWEEVEGTSIYRLDIAYDSEFNNYVSGYENRSLSRDETSITLNNFNNDYNYYVRLRSQNHFTQSSSSETLKVVLIPEAPDAREASNTTVTGFTANWSSIPRVSGYLLDVSTNSDFTSMHPDYDGLDVGNVTSYEISGLTPGTTYYYRVRAVREDDSGEHTSDYSNVMEQRTVGIDIAQSGVDTDATRILANSEQVATMDVTIIAEDGSPAANVPITLEQTGEGIEIEPSGERTNASGEISYQIRGVEESDITLRVLVGTIEITNPITIEVQPYSDQVVIGNNFPNPFNTDTFIPITIPENNTEVHLSIVNILGAQIQTLLDREVMQAGYYEIPFTPSGGLASGVLFSRLITSDGVEINKMTYTK